MISFKHHHSETPTRPWDPPKTSPFYLRSLARREKCGDGKKRWRGNKRLPLFLRDPGKLGGAIELDSHIFLGVKNERNEIFAFNSKMKKNKMSDSQVEERAQKFPFPVGKSTKWLVVRSVREVSPKIYSEPFRFRNYIFRTICRRFSFVVDDALNLLTNLGPRRKSPWSRRIAGIERFDPPFGGWQNRANLPGWSIMLGWCSPFLPRCVKRGNDPCWRAGRWLVG